MEKLKFLFTLIFVVFAFGAFAQQNNSSEKDVPQVQTQPKKLEKSGERSKVEIAKKQSDASFSAKRSSAYTEKATSVKSDEEQTSSVRTTQSGTDPYASAKKSKVDLGQIKKSPSSTEVK